MYTKQQIWNSFSTELFIMKHLAEKVPEDKHHHKPTEKQRTTLELLQYLSIMAVATLRVIIDGDVSVFGTYQDRREAVTVETFAAAIDQQEKEMKEYYDSITDTMLDEEVTIFGRTQSRALFILDHLKTMTGYKMQLFLYVKASGVETIGTSNVWGGIDTPAAKE